jgi:hypothetical protein
LTHRIYDVDEAVGSVHDFTLCKTCLLLLAMCWTMVILADSGYQGIREYHEWSPDKKEQGERVSGGRESLQYGIV